MTTARMESLLGRTQVAALEGTTELFKTTPHFDSTAQNPAWLG